MFPPELDAALLDLNRRGSECTGVGGSNRRRDVKTLARGVFEIDFKT